MSSKSKAPNHLHRYKRANLSRQPNKEYLVFKCTKPLCPTYIPLTLAEGKLCECNKCGDAMILTKVSIRLALPHCDACTKRRINVENVDLIAEYLKDHSIKD